MKKTVVSLATTLMVSAVLVACNTDPGFDITSPGAAPIAKAVCTSSNNWRSVGLGMSMSEVESRLGKYSYVSTTEKGTTLTYEKCRGFLILESDWVAPVIDDKGVITTPAVPAKYSITDIPGSITINPAHGVVEIGSPARIETGIICELDYYNRPYDTVYTIDAQGYALTANCRTPNNQF